MAHFPGTDAGEQAAIQDKAAPDAGAQRDDSEGIAAAAAAPEPFPQSSAVSIIFKIHRQVQILAEQRCQRDIPYGDIGGIEHLSPTDSTGNPNAHGGCLRFIRADFLQNHPRKAHQRFRKGLRIPELQRLLPDGQKGSRFVRHPGAQVGAAHINSNIHLPRLPYSMEPPSARSSTRRASSRAALKPYLRWRLFMVATSAIPARLRPGATGTVTMGT